ncbi:MAG: hypothetical protein J6A12_06335, partial [Oscillospiraceae bacterium]|nr:hypothetical protein [Oscillospiraceae bacterium]
SIAVRIAPISFCKVLSPEIGGSSFQRLPRGEGGFFCSLLQKRRMRDKQVTQSADKKLSGIIPPQSASLTAILLRCPKYSAACALNISTAAPNPVRFIVHRTRFTGFAICGAFFKSD